MVESSRVKLKLFFLLLTVPSIRTLPLQTDPVAQAQGLIPVPQAVVDARTEAENNEWLNAIVARTNGTTDANGNIISTKDRAPLGLELVTTTTPEASTYLSEPVETLECKHYSEERCRNASECEITTETCRTKDHLRHLACHVIFSYPLDLITNSTEKYLPVEKLKVKQMGCMEYQAAHLSDCMATEKCLQQRLNMHSIGMCCCTTPHCNQEGNLWMLNPDLMRDVPDLKHFFVPTEPPQASELETIVKNPLLLWLGIAAFICVLSVVVILAWQVPKCYRKREQKKLDKKNKKHGNVVDFYGAKVMEEGHLPLVANEEVEMQPTPKELPISDWQPLVLGKFSQVYKAKWTSDKGDERWVAVKKMTETLRQSYLAEKEIFEALSQQSKWYSSIVQFVCAEKIGQEYWVVTEFCERLSLYDLLKHNVISIDSCNRIILTMTDGLSFLHETKPFYVPGVEKKSIIHRDIKSKNILVKSDMTACIADFGLARQYSISCEKSDLLGQVGTRRYMCPEMLEGAADFNVQAFKAMDVYSMGLVMWEVISRTKLSPTDEVPDYKVPYDFLGFDPTLGDLRKTVNLMKIRPQWRPEVLQHGLMKDLVKIVSDTWENEGSARTTSGFVFQSVYRLVMEGVEINRSEGYHSGESVEDEDFKVVGSATSDCERTMKRYHGSDEMEHPSPDPSNNQCPPLPIIPILTDEGIIHAADAEPSQKSIHEESAEREPVTLIDASTATSKSTKKPDTYYSVELGRVLTMEEAMPLFIAERVEELRQKKLRIAQAILEGRKPEELTKEEKDLEEKMLETPPSVSVSRRSSITPAGEF